MSIVLHSASWVCLKVALTQERCGIRRGGARTLAIYFRRLISFILPLQWCLLYLLFTTLSSLDLTQLSTLSDFSAWSFERPVARRVLRQVTVASDQVSIDWDMIPPDICIHDCSQTHEISASGWSHLLRRTTPADGALV